MKKTVYLVFALLFLSCSDNSHNYRTKPTDSLQAVSLIGKKIQSFCDRALFDMLKNHGRLIKIAQKRNLDVVFNKKYDFTSDPTLQKVYTYLLPFVNNCKFIHGPAKFECIRFQGGPKMNHCLSKYYNLFQSITNLFNLISKFNGIIYDPTRYVRIDYKNAHEDLISNPVLMKIPQNLKIKNFFHFIKALSLKERISLTRYLASKVSWIKGIRVKDLLSVLNKSKKNKIINDPLCINNHCLGGPFKEMKTGDWRSCKRINKDLKCKEVGLKYTVDIKDRVLKKVLSVHQMKEKSSYQLIADFIYMCNKKGITLFQINNPNGDLILSLKHVARNIEIKIIKQGNTIIVDRVLGL